MRRQNTFCGQIKLLLIVVSLFSLLVTAGEEPKQWTPDDPCPTSIDAIIPNYRTKSEFGTFEGVHEALKTCPNISELHMNCRYGSRRHRLPFRLDGSERYISRPQILSLTGYEFDHDEWSDIRPRGTHPTFGNPVWPNDGIWPVSSSTNPVVIWVVEMFYRARWQWECLQGFMAHLGLLPWPLHSDIWKYEGYSKEWYSQRHTPAERRSIENIQRWLEAMDFSQIHSLTISEYLNVPLGKGVYRDLPRALTGLKTLKVEGQWINPRYETLSNNQYEDREYPSPENNWLEPLLPPALDFITAVYPTLESLTWTDSGPVKNEAFEAILKHHGSSLKYLEWTNTELKPSFFSEEQIRSLGEWARGLTNLTINLGRVDDVWPWKHLKAVAESLPKLKNLTIYLNMYDESSNFDSWAGDLLPAKLPLTKEASLDMFNLLNLFKTGDKIQNVEFRQGDWEAPTDGPKIWEGDWAIRGPRMWTKCTLDVQRKWSKPTCEEGHEDKVEVEWRKPKRST
ncbi:hypothetical protein ACHAQC_005198 [Fusarium culmorum]